MKCFHCRKNNATIHYSYSGDLCRKCFLRLIEARVRKYSRMKGVFKKGDRILVIDNLSLMLVKRIVEDLPFTLLKKKYTLDKLKNNLTRKFIKSHKINKIIIPWTIDDECCLFLARLFSGKSYLPSKYYSLLSVMTDEEALMLAQILGIGFTPHIKNNEVAAFIQSMQKKYPETKFSLVKSIEEMQRILKN